MGTLTSENVINKLVQSIIEYDVIAMKALLFAIASITISKQKPRLVPLLNYGW